MTWLHVASRQHGAAKELQLRKRPTPVAIRVAGGFARHTAEFNSHRLKSPMPIRGGCPGKD